MVPISERRNTAFMGTLVRSGRGEGVVVGTGVRSEFGVVFEMMQEVRSLPSRTDSDSAQLILSLRQIGDRKTPLQLSMDELAARLSLISFGVIGVICLVGVWQKRSWLEMFTIGGELSGSLRSIGSWLKCFGRALSAY